MNEGAALDEAGTSANELAGAGGAGAVHEAGAGDIGGVGSPPNLPIPPIVLLEAAGRAMVILGPGAGGLGITATVAATAFAGGGWKAAGGRRGGTAGLGPGGGGNDAFPTGFGHEGGRPAIESTSSPRIKISKA